AMLIDENGRVLLHVDRTGDAEDGAALMKHALAEGSWRRGLVDFDESYRHGVFTITDRISDTGYAIVYAYSWHTIAYAIWSTMLREFGTTA
ncbi:hypothetical protein QM306_39870, partial [Burkholderia cenocepacia]|nr:hypothetical protein [Burkholderia cenocepacia]